MYKLKNDHIGKRRILARLARMLENATFGIETIDFGRVASIVAAMELVKGAK
jgi:hypothetical protein